MKAQRGPGKRVLTEKEIADLPSAKEVGDPYAVRDERCVGLMVVVNARSRSFVLQRDLWRDRRLIKTVKKTIGRVGQISLKEARSTATELRAQIERGIDPNERPREVTTLGSAWADFERKLERRGRSPGTIRGYRESVERHLRHWLKRPLAEIGADRRAVSALHARITERNGSYAANHALRTLRAIYNHEARFSDDLPPNPVTRAVAFNVERARSAPMGSEDLPTWFERVEALPNPIRRAFHITCLLTGCRPGALSVAKMKHLDLDRAALHIPKPKGGADRAFDIPLSTALIDVLGQLLEDAERLDRGGGWLFPAASTEGHIKEWKEEPSRRRGEPIVTGHALRHVYRTLAAEAGVNELDVKLLLNHALGGDVTNRYLTRGRLMDHLREQQERISRHIMEAAGRGA